MDEGFTIGIETFVLELIVLITIVTVTVVIALKKRIKPAIIFFIITAVLLALETFVRYTVLVAIHEPLKAIDISIDWVPTVLFVLTILWTTLLGVWRGFRKSALLLLHAVLSAGLCIGLFFFCVNSEAVDGAIFSIVDGISGGICGSLGIPRCTTMRGLFTEWIPTLFPYGSELNIVLRENGAYLTTLVDMAYRIVFGIVLYLLYLLLVFILYIIYHAAYSERKYKLRKEIAVMENETDRTYCAHRIAGGAVGLVRGIVSGVLSLAFLGSAFYLVAGVGEKSSPDLNFSDSGADFAYSAFQSLESYGAQGIFRILNAARDSDGQPYYLFAADLIFSGNLDDEENDVHGNIKFREEVGAYTEFARDTWDLMLRYGGDELKEALNGNGDTQEIILRVFEDGGFQKEFEDVIDNFDTKTYFINFALAAATSIINNVDETSLASSMSESTRELLKVVFKPGYLCPKIPDEREMLNSGASGNQPYIGLPSLYSKEDTKIYYKMVVSFLTAKNEGIETLDLVRSLLPQIQRLSVLSGERANKLDPVFGRLYCYIANEYLSGGNGTQGVLYKDVVSANVQWTNEINTLIDTLDDALNVYQACSGDDGISFDNVLALFDEQSEHYNNSTLSYGETMQSYDAVAANLSSSGLLGQVLSTGLVNEKITDIFSSVSSRIYIPQDVKYTNTEEGYGELHQLMYGLKLVGNKEIRENIQKLTGDGNIEIADIFKIITDATQTQDDKGQTLSGYMTDSVILRSLISSVMMDNEDLIYVPEISLERDANGNAVRLIKKDVLGQLFASLADKDVSDPILGFMEDAENNLSTLIKSDAIAETLCAGNGIIEGTVAKQILKRLTSEQYNYVVIPNSLKLKDGALPDGWLTQDGIPGELNKLVSAWRLEGVEVDSAMQNGYIDKSMLKDVMTLNDNAARTLMASDVLRYSMSSAIINDKFELGEGIDLIVPQIVLEAGDGESVIETGEMETLCLLFAGFEINKNSTARDVIDQFNKNIDNISDSAIVCASTANFLIIDERLENIVIPQKYADAGKRSALETNSQNVALWQREIYDFAKAADKLFGGKEEIEIDSKLISGITEEDLHVIYSSKLIAATITDKLKSDEIPLSDHPYAYEYDKDERYRNLREIYRESEIQSLLKVLNGSDIENFELREIGNYKNLIYEEDGTTSSYLLAATFSENLLNNVNLIIPESVVVTLKSNDVTSYFIDAEELYRIIEAFGAYDADAEIGVEGWTPAWVIPERDNISVIIKSAIVRATLTDVIGGQYADDGQGLYFSAANVTVEDRIRKNKADTTVTRTQKGAVSVNEEQLTVMLNLLSQLNGDGDSFLLPEISSIGSVIELSNNSSLEGYLACDTLRYAISDVMANYIETLRALPFLSAQQTQTINTLRARYTGHVEARFEIKKGNTQSEPCNCFTVDAAVQSVSELQKLMADLGL